MSIATDKMINGLGKWIATDIATGGTVTAGVGGLALTGLEVVGTVALAAAPVAVPAAAVYGLYKLFTD